MFFILLTVKFLNDYLDAIFKTSSLPDNAVVSTYASKEILSTLVWKTITTSLVILLFLMSFHFQIPSKGAKAKQSISVEQPEVELK